MPEAMEKIKYYECINKYYKEGFHLCASAVAYVPVFRCTVRCNCTSIGQMSDFDMIICQCVMSGISKITDISFVLSLDEKIIMGIVEKLINGGIFGLIDDKVEVTKHGIEWIEQNNFITNEEHDYDIYMNGITGEWDIMCGETWIEHIPEDATKIMPIKTVITDDISMNSKIILNIQKMENVKIDAVKMLDYKRVLYQEKRIMFFRNEDKYLSFAVYDEEKDYIDTETGIQLREKYDSRQLIEIMQLELDVLKGEQSLDQYSKPIQKIRYIRNEEIRNMFKSLFDTVQKSIFIVSPWIDRFVVTDEFIDSIERALKRGIVIKIYYGYTSKAKLDNEMRIYNRALQNKNKKEIEKTKTRNLVTEWNARDLHKRFEQYSCFEIIHVEVGTHEKPLVYDDKYVLIGSLNLLSYDGGETNAYQGYGFRYEGGAFIEDEEFAQEVMRNFFENQ